MADQKKIIKVNDLTIQAENVHFEPIPREVRPVHPLFGRRPPVVAQPQVTEKEEQEKSEKSTDEETAKEEQVQEQPERRPPFSWI
ncbi:hypothetical protein KQI76_08475 [Amphibacillus sp. MSJ-3]|uniref:hypothetical protein n=1 Tax=Amphibacillus sp. MSJ-3 TaxID=2841505 RepID=UPI001C0EFC4E|nr:hypothetical protein [Amphibacillus sp. MSJ-3]MBU5595199.1 hypothetical protein [Amphibacillus sp. MSJ-3]